MVKTLDIGGRTLAYQEFGSGENYVLSTQNFFFSGCHAELLGKEPYPYHTFLIQTRGFGASDHIFDEGGHDYTKMWAQDMLDFAKTMGIERFYYTGISHGNAAGWYLAFFHPECLRGFVCCNGIPHFVPPGMTRTKPMPSSEELDALVGNREKLRAMAWREEWPTQNAARLAAREKNSREHLEILVQRRREEFTCRNTNIACCYADTQESFDAMLAQIRVPVMLLHGMLDPLATAEDALHVAKTIPGCVFLGYQNLGHGGMDECPELAARNCHRFFESTNNRIL